MGCPLRALEPARRCRELADAHRVASVLLPKLARTGDAGFWLDQARALHAHILDHLARAGTGGLGDLAAIPEDAPAFSFDGFYQRLAEHGGPKPLIFLAVSRRYREAGAPIIPAWIDAAASAILQRDPRTAPQAWLILDYEVSGPPVGAGFMCLSGLPVAKVWIDPPEGLAIIAPGIVPAAAQRRISAAPVSTAAPAVRIEDRDDFALEDLGFIFVPSSLRRSPDPP